MITDYFQKIEKGIDDEQFYGKENESQPNIIKK